MIGRAILSLGGVAVYLALAIWGFGGVAAFFSQPALIALTAVFVALSLAVVFAGGGNISPGVREDRGNRWVLWVVIVVGLIAGYLPAFTDRIEFWTIDGDATRWIGVIVAAIGGTLRIAPVFILGNRFSGLVAIQAGHTLVTRGLYGIIRHPSYLGLLLSSLGWALAFRSGVGVLLAVILVPPIVARMNSEERLLQSEFGAEYDAYREQTSRLIPGIY